MNPRRRLLQRFTSAVRRIVPARPPAVDAAPVKLHVIAVAYRRFGELKVFVQSWLNQSRDNWVMTVIHDGPSAEFDEIMCGFQDAAPGRIGYSSTPRRFNDYGHSLREIGLKSVSGDYVLLTNADNYFVPRALEFINQELSRGGNPDVVMFDMVHSHHHPGGRRVPSYSFFKTDYARGSIDMSAAVVRADLAVRAGFRDKSFAGDATYFEDVAKACPAGRPRIAKIRQVLFVHN